MNARFSRRVHLASRAVSGLLIGAVLGVMLAAALISRLDALGGPDESPDITSSDPAREAIDRHRCSVREFESGTIPSSALIRTPSGDLLLVSFERGWEIYQDPDAQADLVAVCLEQLPPGATQRLP